MDKNLKNYSTKGVFLLSGEVLLSYLYIEGNVREMDNMENTILDLVICGLHKGKWIFLLLFKKIILKVTWLKFIRENDYFHGFILFRTQ